MTCFERLLTDPNRDKSCPYKARCSVIVQGKIHFVCGYHKRAWQSYIVSPLDAEAAE